MPSLSLSPIPDFNAMHIPHQIVRAFTLPPAYGNTASSPEALRYLSVSARKDVNSLLATSDRITFSKGGELIPARRGHILIQYLQLPYKINLSRAERETLFWIACGFLLVRLKTEDAGTRSNLIWKSSNADSLSVCVTSKQDTSSSATKPPEKVDSQLLYTTHLLRLIHL